MKIHKIEPGAGSHFDNVVKQAKSYIENFDSNVFIQKQIVVEFTFNGITCHVNKDTKADLLYRDYSNAWTMDWKTVGPNCLEQYSAEVQNELKEKKKAEEEKQENRRKEQLKKDTEEKEKFEASVKEVELELVDAEGWKKAREINSDGYGKTALDYAEGWGKLMQIEIAKGKTIEECYDYTQEGINFLGITGFQFGAATSTLAQVWKHGQELKRVHNKKYGITEDVKGTVNPAVMTIKK